MGSAELAVRMSAGELGCTYAAMILHDDGLPVTEDGLKALLNAAKVEYDSYWPSLFAKYLDGNMDKLITTPAVGGGGGGAVAAAAPGDAAPGALVRVPKKSLKVTTVRMLGQWVVVSSVTMAMTTKHTF